MRPLLHTVVMQCPHCHVVYVYPDGPPPVGGVVFCIVLQKRNRNVVMRWSGVKQRLAFQICLCENSALEIKATACFWLCRLEGSPLKWGCITSWGLWHLPHNPNLVVEVIISWQWSQPKISPQDCLQKYKLDDWYCENQLFFFFALKTLNLEVTWAKPYLKVVSIPWTTA